MFLFSLWRRTEEGPASQEGVDREHEISSSLRLKYVPLCSNSLYLNRESFRIVSRENKNRNTNTQFPYALRCFEAADARHGDVEDEQIWF